MDISGNYSHESMDCTIASLSKSQVVLLMCDHLGNPQDCCCACLFLRFHLSNLQGANHVLNRSPALGTKIL